MCLPRSPKVRWRKCLQPPARYAVHGFRYGSRRLAQIRFPRRTVSALSSLRRVAVRGGATVIRWTADELSYLSRIASWCRPAWQKLRNGSGRLARALWERLSSTPRLLRAWWQGFLQPAAQRSVEGLAAGSQQLRQALSHVPSLTTNVPSTAITHCRQEGRRLREALAHLGDAMAERLANTPNLPGKILSLALLGFMVVILAGPVLAVLSVILSLAIALLSVGVTLASVLLPFALVGLLVWLPLRAYGQGKRIPWEQIRQAFVEVFRAVIAVPQWLLGHGYASLRRLCVGSLCLGQASREGMYGFARASGVLFLETASGALVGGLMGLMLSVHRLGDAPVPRWEIAAGAITGAYLGVLVGLSSIKRGREVVSGQTLDELN